MCTNCWMPHSISAPVPCMAGVVLGLLVEREDLVTREQAQLYLEHAMDTKELWDVLFPYLEALEQKVVTFHQELLVPGHGSDDPANH